MISECFQQPQMKPYGKAKDSYKPGNPHEDDERHVNASMFPKPFSAGIGGPAAAAFAAG